MPAAVATVLVVLLAATVQGATGFGFSLVAVPLLALVTGARDAVVLGTMLAVGSTVGLAVRFRAETDRPLAGRLLAGAVLGLPLGVLVLGAVPERALLLGIAVVVAGAVGLMVLRPRARAVGPAGGAVPATWAAVVDVLAGLACGALTTSVGTNGPPVVLRLQARRLTAGPFRATTSTVFAVCNAVAVSVFAVTGLVDAELVRRFGLTLLPLLAGLVLGDAVHRRLDPARFRGLVLGLLGASAAAALAGALR